MEEEGRKFKIHVKNAVGDDIDADIIELAAQFFVDYFVGKDNKEISQVAKCIELAKDIQQHVNTTGYSSESTQKSEQANDDKELDFSPDRTVRSEYLAQKILPEVREIRKKIFGTKEAPFQDPDEAEDWLIEQMNRDKPEEQDWIGNFYVMIGDSATPMKIFSNHVFDDLGKFVKRYHEKTQFPEPALAEFVLCDERPTLPTWWWRERNPKKRVYYEDTEIEKDDDESFFIRPEIFELSILCGYATRETFDEIFSSIKDFRGDRVFLIDEKDQVLWNAVQDIGEVSERDGTKQEYWETLLEECQERGISDWTTTDAVRKAWERLQDKLRYNPSDDDDEVINM